MHTKELRFHHLCCMPLFSGNGYSDDFSQNMWQVKNTLEKENPKVILTSGCDSICENCPHREGGNFCIKNGRKNEEVIKKDKAISAHLNLEENYTDNYHSVLKVALRTFTKESFENFCGKCKWGEMGLCGYEKWKNQIEKILEN